MMMSHRLSETTTSLCTRSSERRFSYNVSWATIYMERAGLVARTQRGVYQLTEEGKRLLERS